MTAADGRAAPETDFVPMGEARLDQIVQLVGRHGDGVESSGLEVKGPLDLTKASGVIKVVRFILGMANRGSDVASRTFRGYGVMVIGMGKDGERIGVARGVEEHDLSNRLRKYLGDQGPTWSLSRLPAGDELEFIFVIVDPPRRGDPIYLCRQDSTNDAGDVARDGAIYVRVSSSTREARAGEIESLLRRSQVDNGPAADPVVTLSGSIVHVTEAQTLLQAQITTCIDRDEASRQHRRAQRHITPAIWTGMPDILRGGPELSAEEYAATVEQDTRDGWPQAQELLVATQGPRLSIEILNDADGFLEQPELRVEIDGVRCHRAHDPGDVANHEVAPWLPAPQFSTPPLRFLADRNSAVDYDNSEDSCVITFTPESLPPRTPRSSQAELALETRNTDLQVIEARWYLTARNLPTRLEGTCELDVIYAPAAQLLAFQLADEL